MMLKKEWFWQLVVVLGIMATAVTEAQPINYTISERGSVDNEIDDIPCEMLIIKFKPSFSVECVHLKDNSESNLTNIEVMLRANDSVPLIGMKPFSRETIASICCKDFSSCSSNSVIGASAEAEDFGTTENTYGSTTSSPEFFKIFMEIGIFSTLASVVYNCYQMYATVDRIIHHIVSIKRKFENFEEACQFIALVWNYCVACIVLVWNYCVACIKWIRKQIRRIMAKITARQITDETLDETAAERVQIDENNNTQLLDSTSLLQPETRDTPDGASQHL